MVRHLKGGVSVDVVGGKLGAKGVEEMGYIGRGVGVATWVVDTENYHQLIPIGHVGELLLDGPLVVLGYFNSPEKTADAFVENPE